MRSRLRKLAVTLAMLAILFSTVMASTGIASPMSTPAEVDVFTQKQPYSGKGTDVSSDAFGPEEVVFLHALVTFNGFPLANMLVAFNVKTPNDAHFTISARTNISGIATVNFTILTPPINISENDVFGNWFVLGNVMVEDKVFQDSLTFKVDWIVKLLSVRTIDENLTYRDYFGRGGDVGLEITLRNIAMTLRNATLAVVILDELSIVVNFSLVQDFAVQPNEKLIFLYCKATLSAWAHVGTAKVFVTALTALVSDNGVPYCPSISTEFSIRGTDSLKIDYHDAAAVIVLPSANTIELGQTLSLRTIVRNEGTVTENFSISTYFDDVLLGAFEVTGLSSYSTRFFEFIVDASLLTLGNHTLKASIPPVADEADLTDNEFVDVIQVKPKTPPRIHDVSVINVKASSNSVFIGDTVQINITVINKGNVIETFNLSAYYNSSMIESRLVEALAPASQMILSIVWNTDAVSEGSYRISAFAFLSEDVDPADNIFVDGIVNVKTRPSPLAHDVAILAVQPSSDIAYFGDVLEIVVTVKNLGDFVESFSVMAFYNSSMMGIVLVNGLEPHAQKVLSFHWDTLDAQNVTVGTYAISALASPVAGEEILGNNRYVDGVVQIKSSVPIEVHDVAVLNVNPLSRQIYIGDILDVNVTVRNRGTQTESFDVVLYYDQVNIAKTLRVDNLAAGAERTVVFHWNTTGVSAGNHTLSAYAKPVPLEELKSDNLFVDGIVKFVVATKGWFVPEWFYWFLLLLLLFILFIVLLLWFYKRRKESRSSFYSGWTAWYYGYDPSRKPRKSKKVTRTF